MQYILLFFGNRELNEMMIGVRIIYICKYFIIKKVSITQEDKKDKDKNDFHHVGSVVANCWSGGRGYWLESTHWPLSPPHI